MAITIRRLEPTLCEEHNCANMATHVLIRTGSDGAEIDRTLRCEEHAAQIVGEAVE